MKWTRGGVVALSALAFFGATEIAAQRVESIMGARERLGLTDTQVEDLEVIRREVVQQRTAEMAEMAEMRSQLEAGQIRRSDLMAAMEDRRDREQALAEQRRERVESILTEEQRESVLLMQRRGLRQGVGRGRDGFGPRARADGSRGPRPRGGGFGPR